MKALLDRTDLAPAASAFADACRASRRWSHLLRTLRKRYGVPEHAPHVSGCGVAQATEAEKQEMRDLAETVNRESTRAYSLRPPRVRMTTMRKLGSAVSAQVGSGFCGPRS